MTTVHIDGISPSADGTTAVVSFSMPDSANITTLHFQTQPLNVATLQGMTAAQRRAAIVAAMKSVVQPPPPPPLGINPGDQIDLGS